jgi:hypothetical protein
MLGEAVSFALFTLLFSARWHGLLILIWVLVMDSDTIFQECFEPLTWKPSTGFVILSLGDVNIVRRKCRTCFKRPSSWHLVFTNDSMLPGKEYYCSGCKMTVGGVFNAHRKTADCEWWYFFHIICPRLNEDWTKIELPRVIHNMLMTAVLQKLPLVARLGCLVDSFFPNPSNFTLCRVTICRI